MKRSTILSVSLVLAAVAALAVAGVAAWWLPDRQEATLERANAIERSDEAVDTDADAAAVDLPQVTPASDDTAGEVAEPYEGPGTVDEPVYACVTLEGRQVCDTFGESDEGPGTS